MDKKLYFEITNITLLRTIVEVLDKANEDIRWNFSINNPIVSEIICKTTTKNCFIKSNFTCEFIKELYIGNNINNLEIIINVKKLLNILKSLDKYDSKLKFYIWNKKNYSSDSDYLSNKINSNDSINTLIIEICYINEEDNLDTEEENNKSKTKSKSKKSIQVKKILKDKKFELEILYPSQTEKQIAKINFDKKIKIPNNKFQKTCKDLGILFDYVKIISNDKKLIFSCNNANCMGINEFKYDNEVQLENINVNLNTINGTYSLSDINIFSKLSDISNDFYFQIKNNFILECNYKFNKLGFMDIIYVPIREDETISDGIYIDTNTDNINDNNNLSGKLFFLEINQVYLFKLLCECTEKIINEPIWKIGMDKNSNIYIHMLCNNTSKNINVEYKIKNIFSSNSTLMNGIIELGINLDKLNDVLKTVDKTNTILFYVDKNDKYNLVVEIKNNKNQKNIYKIKLLNIENNSVKNKKDFVKKVIIDSNEFYKICREINSIGEIIKLDCGTKEINFSCMDDTKYINTYKANTEYITIINNDEKEEDTENKNTKIECAYEIKDLILFSKLSNFMKDFKLLICKDGTLNIKSNLFGNSINLTNIEDIETDKIEKQDNNQDELIDFGFIKIEYMSKCKEEIPKTDKKMLNSDIKITDDKMLFFKFKNINFIKNIIDTIDKLVSDVDWCFTTKIEPQIEKESDNESNYNSDSDNSIKKTVGLEIICTDISKTLYVKTKLTDLLFKSYYCKKENFRFAMNIETFNKILKLTDKNDLAVYCYIDSSDLDNLLIRFKNNGKKNKKIFKIPLQILNPETKPPITLNFEKKISIDVLKFHDVCKKINNNCQFIEIKCDNDKIDFNCVGDNKGTIPYDNTYDENLEIINLNDDETVGIYETKNILLFSKLSSITKDFSLFMKNNFALTSIYSFEEYGTITTILSPINEEHINNVSYDYSDDEDDVDLIEMSGNLLDF